MADDTARFTLSIKNAEGSVAFEPNCNVDFQRTDGSTAAQAKGVALPPSRTFIIPAFPQEKNLFCLIRPSLYSLVQSNFFIPNGNKNQTVTLQRLPDQWTPKFPALATLPAPRFDAFRGIMANSTQVDVKHGPVLGRLDTVYDNLAGNQQILAKMALLNLYAVLNDQSDPISNRPWYRFIQQYVRIDQERFVAEADPALFDLVQHILNNLDTFGSKGFFTESASLHLENIPDRYQLTQNLITVKVRYEQGNVQFTMGKATTDGRNVVLLDCDMDEHANIIQHTEDLFIHVFTGGTHPIDMHEYIVHHDPGVQLGYALNPAGAVAAAASGAAA
jgi:hypothetical protein